jgi:hypothetical protein
MVEAIATIEERLAAITANLNDSRRLLASCAWRLGAKEMGKKAASTSSFSRSTLPLFVGTRAPEQLTSKSSPSLTLSAYRVVADGAIYADAALTTTTPTRCSTVGSAVNGSGNHAVVAFPTSGTKYLVATACTDDGNNKLPGESGIGMSTRARSSTHVLAKPLEGSTVGAHAVRTDLLRNTSFPRFDGTNPGLWRVQCLEYFNLFNINRCLWVIAARMHMDGKAKEWFEAYKLRQVVSDWPEFIDDVEAHFGVGDLPPSTLILGVDHLNVTVDASGGISPNVMDKAVEPVTHLAEPVAPSDEMIQTNVGGVSMFLESWLEPAETVSSKTTMIELTEEMSIGVGGSSLFLELDFDSANKVFEDDVLTTVGGVSLFLGLDMDVNYDAQVLTQVSGLLLFREYDRDTHQMFRGKFVTDKVVDRGVSGVVWVLLAVPATRCKKLQQQLSQKMQQHGINSDTHVLPWDPGKQKADINGLLFGWQRRAEICVIQFNLCVVRRSVKDDHVLQPVTDQVLNKLPSWGRGGFSPGNTGQQVI